MRKKFEVTEDTLFAKKGEIVYDQKGWDYGLANDDTRYTGVEHTSVTRNEDGDYPGFTIPKHTLKEITNVSQA